MDARDSDDAERDLRRVDHAGGEDLPFRSEPVRLQGNITILDGAFVLGGVGAIWNEEAIVPLNPYYNGSYTAAVTGTCTKN